MSFPVQPSIIALVLAANILLFSNFIHLPDSDIKKKVNIPVRTTVHSIYVLK